MGRALKSRGYDRIKHSEIGVYVYLENHFLTITPGKLIDAENIYLKTFPDNMVRSIKQL
jgi:hypothetical protein